MSTIPKTLLTPEQYLEIERAAEYKSEFFNGEMFAMAGAREAHNLIAGNAYGQIWQQLHGRPCRVYGSDMRVRTANGLYTYPDLSAVCGDRTFADEVRDTLLNPSAVIEILSPSTEAYDRGRKFESYQTIDSLREYLLLATDHMRADLYVRQANGEWVLRAASAPDDIVTLESVGCTLKLADLYDKVEFEP